MHKKTIQALILLVAFTASAVYVAAQQPPGQERVEVELVEINRWGFYPPKLTVNSGRFRLRLQDGSHLPETELRLFRKNDNHLLKAQQLSRSSGRVWRDTFNLSPGTYVLTEANHPEWQLEIVVRRQGQ